MSVAPGDGECDRERGGVAIADPSPRVNRFIGFEPEPEAEQSGVQAPAGGRHSLSGSQKRAANRSALMADREPNLAICTSPVTPSEMLRNVDGTPELSRGTDAPTDELHRFASAFLPVLRLSCAAEEESRERQRREDRAAGDNDVVVQGLAMAWPHCLRWPVAAPLAPVLRRREEISSQPVQMVLTLAN